MKYLYGLAILCCLVLWSSCRNDFESEPSSGNLEFSKDTVFLDTIFSNIGSSTYNLKVYNKSNKDINIPTIRLGDGESSNYRLNVDGIPGRSFENINVLAKDSIFIFIETTVDASNTVNNSILYTDQILFDTGTNEQKVELVTLVKDAVFLFPEQFGDGTTETLNLGMDSEGGDILIEGFFLDDSELTFTNEKPYVIYGYAAVPPGKTLNVEAGARIHFHANSGILVANTGSMKVHGEASADPELLENEVIFEGDRLEPAFSNVPGQWGAIWLTNGSTNNEFNYTTIKNGTVGLLMDNNDGDRTLTLINVQIYNSANVGLLIRTGDVYGENVVINNSGQTSLSCSFGGRYNFNHCTFANYWTQGFRSFTAIQIDNIFPVSETETLTANLIEANFTNCIIYGNEQREFTLIKDASADFNFSFKNCLIRFDDPQGQFNDDPLYDFTNQSLYPNTVISEDPVFQDTENNNLNIEAGTSGAEGIGAPNIDPAVDLNGTPRVNPPDAGAFESTIFPED